MADFYRGNIPIIDVDAHTEHALLRPKDAHYGLIPRDYAAYPEEMFASPDEMSVIPKSEWDARFDEQEALQSSLEHIYLGGPNGTPIFKNLDQNGDGYCWAYSTGHSIMLDRAKRNLPLVRLNPHATAAIIKNGRNEGGWCGLSAKWGRENGYAVEGTGPGQWPLQSRNLKYDTPLLRTEMAKYKLDEEWVDLTKSVYDQNLTIDQCATGGLNNIPGPGDYNWWSHSVCRIRWVRLEANSWGQLILNSWSNWGRYGLGVLRGTKAVPNCALAVRSTTA